MTGQAREPKPLVQRPNTDSPQKKCFIDCEWVEAALMLKVVKMLLLHILMHRLGGDAAFHHNGYSSLSCDP